MNKGDGKWEVGKSTCCKSRRPEFKSPEPMTGGYLELERDSPVLGASGTWKDLVSETKVERLEKGGPECWGLVLSTHIGQLKPP